MGLLDKSTMDEITMSYKTMDNTCEFTATTFRKTSRLPQPLERINGTPFIWQRSWANERITNEAHALELVRQQTKIPVPRLIGHGTHPDGTRYLITERIDGIPLNMVFKESCLIPEGKAKHTAETPCQTCVCQAYSNAVDFIEKAVQPQLEKMTSHERGLQGFVMPPQWLAIDIEPPWKGIKGPFKTLRLDDPQYVFQHGDIAAHNIFINAQTSQVISLIDWEYAGYFPVGMDRWTWTLDNDACRNRVDVMDAIAKFLPEEYLECYDQWQDKTQLKELVASGKIPDPEILRKAGHSIV